MANKLRYGTRFGQAGIGIRVSYNETDDIKHRKDLGRMLGAMKNQPLHKQELRHYKVMESNKKRRAAAAPGPEREEAERRMAEAVRKCVEILEFHMDDMIQHVRAPGRPHYCLQTKIHNVIYELRHKCGVTFAEEGHYTERVSEDQRRRSEKEIVDDMRTEREQQRISRLRNMKEQAERFAKWRAK